MKRLAQVIDLETGVGVVWMRLIEDLKVDGHGHVKYRFRLTSPFCPLAVPFSMAIKQAVGVIKGVNGQDLEVVGSLQSEELTELLRQTGFE